MNDKCKSWAIFRYVCLWLSICFDNIWLKFSDTGQFVVNMEVDGNVGCMEAEALKRKERLKQLKRKHEELSKEEASTEGKSDTAMSLPKPKFRSYRPQDENLKENVVPDAKPGDVVEEVKDQLSSAHAKVVIEELDITNLAPRKPDWDLKRDVAKKLERLERRTQKAIAELIRDRLRKGQEDLANSVNAGARINEIDAANED